MTIPARLSVCLKYLPNVWPLIATVIGLGFLRWVGVVPVHFTMLEGVLVGPILAALLFKPSGRTFWFISGIAIGSILAAIVLSK